MMLPLPMPSTCVPDNCPRADLAANTRLEPIFCSAPENDRLMVSAATICSTAEGEIACESGPCCANVFIDGSVLNATAPRHEATARVKRDEVLFIGPSPSGALHSRNSVS